MDGAQLSLYLQNFVQNQMKSYSNQNTGMPPLQDHYNIGDYIKAKSASGNYIQEGKFFVNDMGPYGECTKTQPVQFMNPVEDKSCGYKIVFFFFI
jgi:hypothetical protein